MSPQLSTCLIKSIEKKGDYVEKKSVGAKKSSFYHDAED